MKEGSICYNLTFFLLKVTKEQPENSGRGQRTKSEQIRGSSSNVKEQDAVLQSMVRILRELPKREPHYSYYLTFLGLAIPMFEG